MSDDLQVALRAALAGAEVGMRWFAGLAGLRREIKPDGSVVTEADRAVEAAVREVLSAERPGDAVLGEEGGQQGGDRSRQGGEVGGRQGAVDRRWIVDPIDGTALFVAGDDRWLVLVALESEGEIVAGVAAIPAQGIVFWAERGGGAWEAPMSDLAAARRLTVAPGARPGEERSRGLEVRLGVVPQPAVAAVDVLLTTTPGLPWRLHPPLLVARGELDLAVQTSGYIWDFAATSLIIAEAGGVYRTLGGSPRPGTGLSLFARDPELAAQTAATLSAAERSVAE